jgi:(2Fe-2S) ferredoxin
MKPKKKTKRKLEKKLGARLGEHEVALVVCVGDKCAPRKQARALIDEARVYASGRVRVEPFGCLDVCKKGPIVATLPKIRIKKRVDETRAHALIDKLAARVSR